MASQSTKILLVEHNPDDIELILDGLKNSEINFLDWVSIRFTLSTEEG